MGNLNTQRPLLSADPAGRFSHLLWAVPVMAVWGTSYVVIQAGLRDTTPAFFASLRALPAGIAILVFDRLRPGRKPVPALTLREGLHVTLLGLLCTGVFFWAMFAGTPRVGAGLASVLVNTQPFFVAGGAYAFLGESLGLRRMASLLSGFMGVVMISLPRMFAGPAGDFLGIGILLLGSAGFAVGLVLSKRLYQRYDLYWLTGSQLTVGGLALLVMALGFEDISATRWTPSLLWAVLYLSLLGTGITSLLWFRLVRFHSVATLSAFGFLSPAVGVVLAWLVYSEQFSPLVLSGMFLVLAGLYGMGGRARGGASAKT